MDGLQESITRIKEWLARRGAGEIVANLNPGVTSEDLRTAAEQGFLVTDEIKELYRLHDGQRDWENNLFLPNAGFLPIAMAGQITDVALESLFGCPQGHRTPVEEMAGHEFWHAADEDLFREEEWTPEWFCFGYMYSPDEYLLQHCRSGRVFSWQRKGPCSMIGDSLGGFFKRFADDLHAGRCSLCGDPGLPGVDREGFVHRKRYIEWSYPDFD